MLNKNCCRDSNLDSSHPNLFPIAPLLRNPGPTLGLPIHFRRNLFWGQLGAPKPNRIFWFLLTVCWWRVLKHRWTWADIFSGASDITDFDPLWIIWLWAVLQAIWNPKLIIYICKKKNIFFCWISNRNESFNWNVNIEHWWNGSKSITKVIV